MLITRKSLFSGSVNTIDIPCTEAQFRVFKAGADPKLVMPACSADHLEFINTGITPSEWQEAVKSNQI